MLYVQNSNFKMDSFELNKIIAAILMVALLVIGLGKIADGVFHVNKPEKQGYKVEVENQIPQSPFYDLYKSVKDVEKVFVKYLSCKRSIWAC